MSDVRAAAHQAADDRYTAWLSIRPRTRPPLTWFIADAVLAAVAQHLRDEGKTPRTVGGHGIGYAEALVDVADRLTGDTDG